MGLGPGPRELDAPVLDTRARGIREADLPDLFFFRVGDDWGEMGGEGEREIDDGEGVGEGVRGIWGRCVFGICDDAGVDVEVDGAG